MSASTIIGIDPGSRTTGYGIIVVEQHEPRCITFGTITSQLEDFAQRIHAIYQQLRELIKHYQPTEAAIEQVFMHTNAAAALKLGQARGAALIALTDAGLNVSTYSPRQIKQAVVGYGAAQKTQVQQMIKALLKLDSLPPHDAADALAIALCHYHTSRYAAKIKQAIEGTST